MCTNARKCIHYKLRYFIYISISSGGFNLATGVKISSENEIIIKTYETLSLNSDGEDDDGTKYLDFNLHTNLKTDYIIHTQQQILRRHEIKMLSKICEMERLSLLTILQMSRSSAGMAGYLLTGNRSRFIQTDGALAWLYSCEKRESHHKQTEKCYDHIPIWYNSQTQFVDTVTRKIVDQSQVLELTCDKAKEYVFQLNENDPDSWFNLVPFPLKNKAPKKFQVD